MNSQTKEAAPIVEAAERWKRKCLIDGGSLFGDEHLWTRERFAELKRWFVDRPDTSSDSFLEKLERQLEPASPEAKRLMAEAAWVYSLILVPRNMRHAKKVSDIRTIHGWSGQALPEDHRELGDHLGQGLASAGMAYNTGKWREFAYLVETMLDWCSRPREDRTSLLEDPFRFAEWLDGLSGSNKRQFRHVLLFLLFPDTFEPLLSTSLKQEIAGKLGNDEDGGTPTKVLEGIALDEALRQVRKQLQDHDSFLWYLAKPPSGNTQSKDVGNKPADGPDRRTLPTDEPAEPYDEAAALKDLFVDEEQFRRILASIKHRKNLILQGPPGTGKTFIARRIAWCLIERKDDATVEMVQFHQSYAYEDFVQGYRPNASGGFDLRDGVFYRFCKRAEADPERPHVFIIDEINRGNLSRIFGELLMLIEADKRGPDQAIVLAYGSAKELFSVPRNVHLLGLMNTADRSLAIVDYALRRRFAFETLDAAYGRPQFRDYLARKGVPDDVRSRIDKNLLALNQRIAKDKDLGPGFCIGHSYFVPDADGAPDSRWTEWYEDIVTTLLAPLLREYWFDRPEEAEKLIGDLRVPGNEGA